MYDLDPLELQILELLVRGCVEKYIISSLRISESTFHSCVDTIISKLSARTLYRAVALAVAQNLIQFEADNDLSDLSELLSSSCLSPLTKREKEVCITCVKYPNKTTVELALELDIAKSTFKLHIRRIYPKLGVKNRAGLVSYIMGNGVDNQE